jgi:hypothetical protein
MAQVPNGSGEQESGDALLAARLNRQEIETVRTATVSPGDAETYLALGIDSGWVRACLLEPVGGRHRLITWGEAERSAGQSTHELVARVCQRMGAQIGRRLWDAAAQMPLLQSSDPVREPPIGLVTAVMSLAAPLRVWLAGLSAERSLAAARRAVQSSPSTIVGVTALNRQLDAARLRDELLSAQPQILVICGGYERASHWVQDALWRLCRVLGSILDQLPPQQRPLCLYAGNQAAAAHVVHLLGAANGSFGFDMADFGVVDFGVVDNVHPAPGAMNLSALSRALYAEHARLCQRSREHTQLGQLLTPPAQLVSPEVAFAQLVQAWLVYKKLPELHGVLHRLSGRMHVYASRRAEAIQAAFTPSNEPPAATAEWPPAQVMSGAGGATDPIAANAQWRDEWGLAPVVASVGQVDPVAMLQVLEHDLFQA